MARATTMKVCALALALCFLAAGAADAKGGPNATPTPAPTPAPTAAKAATATASSTTAAKAATPTAAPSPATTTAKAATPTAAPSPATTRSGPTTTTAASSGSPGSSKYDPMVSPYGDKCVLATPGKPVEVNGYPSSPFSTKSFVFTNKFKELYVLDNMLKGASYDRPCNNDGQCMDGHILNIEEFMADFGLNGTICEGASVPLMGYNKMAPGPLIIGQVGVQNIARFTNKVSPDSKFYPPAGPGMAGEGSKDLCQNRAAKYQHAPGIKAGYGRAFSTHHHGMASTSDMDGWAEQYFCHGESKDYVLPNNRHATLYYHDHAVGITSENTYAGLTGMRLTRPCAGDDPFNVENLDPTKTPMPEHHLVIQDFVLENPRPGEPGICRRLYDRMGVHKDQLWGDIQVVNGVPWPVLEIKAIHQRFRILNASPSRPYILQFKNEAGKSIGQDRCRIIGGDGDVAPWHPGTTPNAITWPAAGLLTDIAYRWDVVCDFSGLEGQTLFLENVHDPARTTSETPFFCYSHLIMKLTVSKDTPLNPRMANFTATTPLEQNAALPPKLLAQLTARALNGETDRTLKFGKSSGMWLLNDRGWDHNDNLGKGKHIEFDNVGQNNVELWTLESGGGWIHPVHIHLVDFFCVAMKGDGGGWKPCPPELTNVPKDVIHIGANTRQLTLAARYGPHLGEYMMHCHNGVHEDHDMFRAFMIIDAMKGLTFSATPSYNYTAIADAPQEKMRKWGDWRNTTYTTPDLPTLNSTYARKMLERQYYRIFYPPPGDYLDTEEHNMWLTTCGRGTPNNDDDETELPLPTATPDPCAANPSDCQPSGGSNGNRRLLQQPQRGGRDLNGGSSSGLGAKQWADLAGAFGF